MFTFSTLDVYIIKQTTQKLNAMLNYEDDYYEEDERTYERYNGSYAQDVEGYSDDDIDTIFDGDPDAYWNIDWTQLKD